MSHYAKYMVGLAARESAKRGQRDPRRAEDLYLPGFAQRLRTANVLLRTARTREAIQNILAPLWQALETARRERRGDTARAAAAEQRMAGIQRLYQRTAEGLR